MELIRASSAKPASPAARAAATRCATSPATRAPATLADELFDVTPYAGAYVRYFVRHPTTQMMPRKIKTAFTATDADNAITQIHDIAFTPRLRDGVRGVEVRVGGGTSIMPRLAPVLYEFVELDNGDYLKVTEAVLRIFDRQDFLRVNRARARIKVLIDKIGIDAFREMVEEELQGDWVAERDFSLDETPARARRAGERSGHAAQRQAHPTATSAPSTASWRATSSASARRASRPSRSRSRRGDVTPEQLRGLGQIMRDYTGGYARTTVHQNLVLRWVRDEAMYDVWKRLAKLDLGDAGSGRDHRRGQLPRHRLLQARDHELDGAQPRCQRAPVRDGDRRSADAARSTSR